MAKTRKPEKFLLRGIKGALVPMSQNTRTVQDIALRAEE